MTGPAAARPVFVTLVREDGDLAKAALWIESLRTFGGSLSESPVWVFEGDRRRTPCGCLRGSGTSVFPLSPPVLPASYPFLLKAAACARAEEMAGPLYRSLVWMAPSCLVVAPPLLLDLGCEVDAALRPVHVANIGSPAGEPPDAFWRSLFRASGTEESGVTVESFVDCRTLRAYYNTHVFAVNPALGLMGEWLRRFVEYVTGPASPEDSRLDAEHRIFLHQAVLSVLLAQKLAPSRVRMLPEEYGYPYHLQARVPPDRRAEALNELVCISYEEKLPDPEGMTDIVVEEPLLSWLSSVPVD